MVPPGNSSVFWRSSRWQGAEEMEALVSGQNGFSERLGPETAWSLGVYTLRWIGAGDSGAHDHRAAHRRWWWWKDRWTLLEEIFPDKLKHDHLAECLREVFALQAKEGESVAEWTSRVQESFSKCRRQVSVEFPAEARGWITLNYSGLSSRSAGHSGGQNRWKSQVWDSGFKHAPLIPDYVASTKAKKWNAAFLADPPHGFHEDEFHHAEPGDSIVFEEVEAFLSEYGVQAEDFTGEFDEAESAEILAANWKDRRNEIARLQKTQNFKQVFQHQFKENLSEVKKRTRCRKSNKLGHWARECTMAKGKGKTSASSSDWSGQAHGAALVEGQPLNEPWCCLNICWFLALVLVLSSLAVARRWLVKQHSMSCSGCMRKGDRAAMPSQTERFVCLWKQQRRVFQPWGRSPSGHQRPQWSCWSCNHQWAGPLAAQSFHPEEPWSHTGFWWGHFILERRWATNLASQQCRSIHDQHPELPCAWNTDVWATWCQPSSFSEHPTCRSSWDHGRKCQTVDQAWGPMCRVQ